MANITYILGAGASFNAIPIVSEMSVQIGETINWVQQIENIAKSQSRRFSLDFQELKRRLYELMAWCRPDQNFSIDTYAKKLISAKKYREYILLKEIVTLYFLLQQKRKGVDLRYDNFWASILSQDKLPSNIKILSWNYDYQLELSYQDFFNSSSLFESATKLNIMNPSDDSIYMSASEFGVFKLNGSATVKRTSSSDVTYLMDRMKNMDDIEFFSSFPSLDVFEKNNLTSMITFAWEKYHSQSFFSQLYQAILDTEIVVVIGYSFPFFNRDIDKTLFSKTRMPQLEKIYIQDPKSQSLKTRITGLIEPGRAIEYEAIDETGQFFLPYEL